MLTLLEPDPAKGLTELAIKEQLLVGWRDDNGLHGVVESDAAWGFEGGASRGELVAALFAREPIEWNRIGVFQDITMRLIAERVLPRALEGTTLLQGEAISTKVARLPPPRAGCEKHVYCSSLVPGGEDLLAEVAVACGFELEVTSAVGDLPTCECMLCYLTSRTWRSGDSSEAFAEELMSAMDLGVRILLAHEMPGVGGQELRHACEFGTLFSHEDGSTPRELLQRGIYSTIAVPLKGGAWRRVSMVLLGEALVEAPVPRKERRRSSVRTSRTSKIVASLSRASKKNTRGSNASCDSSASTNRCSALGTVHKLETSEGSTELDQPMPAESADSSWVGNLKRAGIRSKLVEWRSASKGASEVPSADASNSTLASLPTAPASSSKLLRSLTQMIPAALITSDQHEYDEDDQSVGLPLHCERQFERPIDLSERSHLRTSVYVPGRSTHVDDDTRGLRLAEALEKAQTRGCCTNRGSATTCHTRAKSFRQGQLQTKRSGTVEAPPRIKSRPKGKISETAGATTSTPILPDGSCRVDLQAPCVELSSRNSGSPPRDAAVEGSLVKNAVAKRSFVLEALQRASCQAVFEPDSTANEHTVGSGGEDSQTTGEETEQQQSVMRGSMCGASSRTTRRQTRFSMDDTEMPKPAQLPAPVIEQSVMRGSMCGASSRTTRRQRRSSMDDTEMPKPAQLPAPVIASQMQLQFTAVAEAAPHQLDNRRPHETGAGTGIGTGGREVEGGTLTSLAESSQVLRWSSRRSSRVRI